MGNSASSGHRKLPTAHHALRVLLLAGGHTQLLAMLDSANADLANLAKTRYFPIGKSPLHLAVNTDSVDVVKLILALGFDVNATEVSSLSNDLFKVKTSTHYFPALHSAVDRGDLAVVKTLLDLGANISTRGRINGVWVGAAECYAEGEGYTDVVRVIRCCGATAALARFARSMTDLGRSVRLFPAENSNALTASGSRDHPVSSFEVGAALDSHRHAKSYIEKKLKRAADVDAKLKKLHMEAIDRNNLWANTRAQKRKLLRCLEISELKLGQTRALLSALNLLEYRLHNLEKEEKLAMKKEDDLMSRSDYRSSMNKKYLENTLKGLRQDETEHRADML